MGKRNKSTIVFPIRVCFKHTGVRSSQQDWLFNLLNFVRSNGNFCAWWIPSRYLFLSSVRNDT